MNLQNILFRVVGWGTTARNVEPQLANHGLQSSCEVK